MKLYHGLLLLALAMCCTADCGTACFNSGQCSNTTDCTRCVEKKCAPANVCGETCSVDSDCSKASGCGFCTAGVCKSAGLCGDNCINSTDCISMSLCSSCEKVSGSKFGQCKSPCKEHCESDVNCRYDGSTCAQCVDQICQAGGCGTRCFTDGDCKGQGNCTHCSGFRCSSICKDSCKEDSDCNGAFTGCGKCSNGSCAPGQCGSACGTNNDCMGESKCSACDQNKGKCVPGAACDSDCDTDSDCDQTSTCPFCRPHADGSHSTCSA